MTGYIAVGNYPRASKNEMIFEKTVCHGLIAFFAFSFAVSAVTTSLMAWRIWKTEKASAAYRTSDKHSLMPVFRILVDSAAHQALGEAFLFVLCAAEFSALYMELEAMTHIVVRPLACPGSVLH